MSKNQDLIGVGGWLLLLVIGLAILGPLSGLGRTVREFEEVEKNYPGLLESSRYLQFKQISWWIVAATSAISISAGIRLWKVFDWSSVRFGILSLWVVGPGGGLGSIIAAFSFFGSEGVAKAAPPLLQQLFIPVLGAGVWSLYLLRSTRVRNTYGGHTPG